MFHPHFPFVVDKITAYQFLRYLGVAAVVLFRDSKRDISTYVGLAQILAEVKERQRIDYEENACPALAFSFEFARVYDSAMVVEVTGKREREKRIARQVARSGQKLSENTDARVYIFVGGALFQRSRCNILHCSRLCCSSVSTSFIFVYIAAKIAPLPPSNPPPTHPS